MKRLALAASLAVSLPALAGEDGLRRLETDPSPQATRRLSELYRKAKDPDQRFWLIQALGERLRSHSDPEALEALLEAAAKGDPSLRGSALRELSSFGSLPGRALEEGRLTRLASAAQNAARDGAPAVRAGASELLRALELWRGASPAGRRPIAPAEEPSGPRRWLWAWALLLPALAGLWVASGLPVLDRASEPGRLARQAFAELREEPALFAVAFPFWAALSAILAGYGFDALARGLGQPLYSASASPFAAWLAAGACVFLPGSLAAARLAGGRSPWAALGALPRLAVLGLAAWLAAHAELAYRLLWRVPGKGRRGLAAWMLETGALRCGYLASAVAARGGHGVVPALRRARELAESGGLTPLGLSAFDARFALLGAAPVAGVLSLLASRVLPVSWRAAAPLVGLGCVLWAWAVLAGTLFAVVQLLEGAAAGRVCRSGGGEDER